MPGTDVVFMDTEKFKLAFETHQISDEVNAFTPFPSYSHNTSISSNVRGATRIAKEKLIAADQASAQQATQSVERV